MNHPEILAAIVCIVFLAIAFVIECSRHVLKKRLQPGSRWAERNLIRSKTAAFREMRENLRLEAERANAAQDCPPPYAEKSLNI
jgi:hypothetical protein